MREKSWADVVRESQEAVELALKGLLRACGVTPPRVHDVSDVLPAGRKRIPALQSTLEELAEISRTLRRDRELAFYGAEELTPLFVLLEEAGHRRAGGSGRRPGCSTDILPTAAIQAA